MMRTWLITAIVLLASGATAEEVYRTVDENGNVIYTDKPSENAEKIEVYDIQTIESDAPEFVYTPPETDKPLPYTQLSITSPENNSVFQDNTGSVAVTVVLEPGLQRGHTLVLMLDGNSVAEGAAGQISLSDVERGIHTLVAVIKDNEGKEVMSSSPVTFTLQRNSKLHKPSTVGKPPKPKPTPKPTPKP